MSTDFARTNSPFGFLRAEYASIAFGQRHLGLDSFIYGGPILAHYTNLSGMVGIIESGGFWLSDIRFLNDVEEYDHGRQLTQELIDAIIDRKRHGPFVGVLREAVELLSRPLRDPYYVASFSGNPDSLEQWRAYARGADGVSLVFDNAAGYGRSHFAVLPHLRPAKAVYENSVKKRVLLHAIGRFSLEYRKDLQTKGKAFTSSIDVWANHLVGALQLNFVTFKHPAFSAENEIRVIAYASQAKSFGGVRHRVFGGRIVPYLSSASLYDEKFVEAGGLSRLPLREVIIGPIANQEVTIQSVKAFLVNTGYTGVPVRASVVPYRG